MAKPVDVESAGEDPVQTPGSFEPSQPPIAPTLPSSPPVALARYFVGAILCGKYRLDALLGEGGMGAVWRATNLLLDLPVAIKLIRADLDRDALRARLQLEARSVAKLGHPGIVRIYDVGETDYGDPFIVMELLQGETLAQLLSRGRVSAVHAVQLLLPIIDACAVAHTRGVVHRDLKPDNIFLSQGEDLRVHPKILDFGIVKLMDPRDGNHRLTEVGTVVGSPDYMSPEQARGCDDVDYRTDIWSICVVLYEAVTGTAPFAAANYNALLRAIVEDEPKALAEHAAGDSELWQILRRGLAKDRDARPRSMAELGRALAVWLLSHGAHEDASGTAVDSKWLGRASDPAIPDVFGDGHVPAQSAAGAKATHDSHLRGHHVDSRAPFTATIRPSSSPHALRAAGAVVALLAAGVFMFAWSTHPRPGAAEPAQAANIGALPASPPPPATAAQATPRVTVTAAPAATNTAQPPAGALSATVPTPASDSKSAVTKPVATALRKRALPAATPHPPPAAARNTPAPKAARDLDLISPY